MKDEEDRVFVFLSSFILHPSSFPDGPPLAGVTPIWISSPAWFGRLPVHAPTCPPPPPTPFARPRVSTYQQKYQWLLVAPGRASGSRGRISSRIAVRPSRTTLPTYGWLRPRSITSAAVSV